jgi:hypothetical protein
MMMMQARRKSMFEILKNIFTAREPGEGYFGGAEGAIRFVIFGVVFVILAITYVVVF